MPKTNGSVQTFKVKNGDKDKNNKLVSFRIDVMSYKKSIKPLAWVRRMGKRNFLYNGTFFIIQKEVLTHKQRNKNKVNQTEL